MRSFIVMSLLAGAVVLSWRSPGEAAGVVVAAPPPAIVEAVPAAPAVGYVWRPGYWRWTGARYAWVAGAYVLAPRPGVVWAPGYWARRPRGWVWVGGRWR